MKDAADQALAREFRIFARHIARERTSSYQAEKYRAAHARFDLRAPPGFDGWLLSVARSGAAGIWLADAYSGWFARKSVVRAKLVLTLALLESAPRTYAELDRPHRGGWLALIALGAEAGLGVLLGSMLLGPVHAWFAATQTRR